MPDASAFPWGEQEREEAASVGVHAGWEGSPAWGFGFLGRHPQSGNKVLQWRITAVLKRFSKK